MITDVTKVVIKQWWPVMTQEDVRGERVGFIGPCHLRYFLAVVEAGSFRSAGRSLRVQASSVVRHIRQLEHLIGASLFLRCRRGAGLSPAGYAFHFYASISYDSLKSGLCKISTAVVCPDIQHLRVGLSPGLSVGAALSLLGRFTCRHSGVKIDITFGKTSDHVCGLRMGAIDFAIMADKCLEDDIESVGLWTDKLHIVSCSKHEFNKKEILTLSDLSGQILLVSDRQVKLMDLYFSSAEEIVEASGGKINIRLIDWTDADLFAKIESGAGMTVLSDESATPSSETIATRPILGKSLKISAAWHCRNNNPALKELLHYIAVGRSCRQWITVSDR